MPNEFVAKNGLISQGNITATGSLVVSQNISASNISASGTISASVFSGAHTGSTFGTSSWATNALTATTATTATTANALNTGNSYQVTNLTASNISGSGTGSFGMVGIGTSTIQNALTIGVVDATSSCLLIQSNIYNNLVNGQQITTQLGFLNNSSANLHFARWTGAATTTDHATVGQVSNAGTYDLQFSAGRHTTGSINYFTASAIRMTIKSDSGNVGIGTTSPNALLNVGSGTPSTAANGIQFGSDTSANLYRISTGTIKTDGGLTVGGTTTTVNAMSASGINVNGNINASSFTGSVFGTSSWATNSLTASSVVGTVTSASYAVSSSFSTTAGALVPTNNYTVANLTSTGTSSLGYVGIGTTIPTSILDVVTPAISLVNQPSINGRFSSNADGRGLVRIINSNPSAVAAASNAGISLVAFSNVSVQPFSSSHEAQILLGTTTGANGELRIIAPQAISFNVSASNVIMTGSNYANYGNPSLYIHSNGRVGIGTIIPSNALDVVGSISCSAITGSHFGTSSWATNALTASSLVAANNYQVAALSINTSSVLVPFTVHGTTYSASAAGSAANSIMRISGQGTNGVLDIGFNADVAPGFAWFQSRNKLDYSVFSNLSLNPVGGNVGIGTTNPATKLSVAGTISATDTITATDTLYIQKGVGGYLSYITAEQTVASTGNSFKFWNSGAGTLMTIGYNGNVGIGTNPVNKLDVVGNISCSVITASLFSGAHTGSTFGTSSWSNNSLTASSLIAASSYAINNLTASNISASGNISSSAIWTANASIYNPNSTAATLEVAGPANSSGSFAVLASSGDNTASVFTVYGDNSPRTPRFNINRLGNVGIGTTVPGVKLDVFGTARILTNGVPASGSGMEFSYVGGGSPYGTIYSYNRDTPSYIDTILGAGGNQLFLKASGNVGVGTTIPNTLLNVGSGTPSTAANGLQFGSDTNANLYRSSNAIIKTDGSLIVAAVLSASSLQTTTTAAGVGYMGSSDTTYGSLLDIYSTATNNRDVGIRLYSGSISTAYLGYTMGYNGQNQSFVIGRGVFVPSGVNPGIVISGVAGNQKVGINMPTTNSVATNTLDVYGNISASSFTGSHFGTSSWATNALTASYVSSSNIVGTVTSASYALSSSYAVSTSAVSGSLNKLSKFTGAGILGDSTILDDGSNVNIGSNKLFVSGSNSVFIGRTTYLEPTLYRSSLSTIDVVGSITTNELLYNFNGSDGVKLMVNGLGAYGCLFASGSNQWSFGYVNNPSYTNPASSSLWNYVLNYNTVGVGIGTRIPVNKLDIVGGVTVGSYSTIIAPNNGIIISGQVGIGTTNPVNKLDVAGNISCSAITASNFFGTSSWAISASYAPGGSGLTGGTTNYIPVWTGANSLSSSVMYQSGAYVGVGLTNPMNRLDVAGNISCSVITASLFFGTSSFAITATTANALNTGNNYTIAGLTVQSGSLSTVSGSSITIASFIVNNSNAGYLNIIETRFATGSDWTTARTRIQKVTDTTNQAYIDFNPSGSNYGIAFGTGAGGVEQLRIDSSGRVGVGTSNPVNKLDVAGNISCSVITASLFFGTSSWSNNALTAALATSINFTASNATTAQTASSLTIANSYRITNLTASNISGSGTGSFGMVGVGTAIPLGKLHVYGLLRVGGAVGDQTGTIALGNDTNATSSYGDNGMFRGGIGTLGGANYTNIASWQGIVFNVSNAEFGSQATRMLIDVNGNVGIGTTSPTAKLQVIAGNSPAISILSNNAGQYASQYIGRTASELELGIAASTNQFFTGTVAGDAVIKQTGTGKLHLGYASAAPSITIDVANNVGIGTTSPSYKLQVVGSFSATTKSFVIEHPTKAGKKLIYGSLESPYHGVRLTGKGKLIKGKGVIQLPDYINSLVDFDNANVQITNIKHNKAIYVDNIDEKNNIINVVAKIPKTQLNKELEFYWTFTAVRKDVPNLQVEL